MSTTKAKTMRTAASSIFPSLFFAALGFFLTQLWVSQLHGSLRSHAVLAVPGCALTGVALYRAKLHWFTRAGTGYALKLADIFWLLGLAGCGVIVGFVISAGSILGLALSVGVFYVVPWSKISVCRTHFMVAFFVAFAGAVAWLALHNIQMHPLHYLVVAWLLWMPPLVMQLLVMARVDNAYRLTEDRAVSDQQTNTEVPIPQ